MPAIYVCRKCGKNHSKAEFDRSRFCKVCGSLIIREYRAIRSLKTSEEKTKDTIGLRRAVESLRKSGVKIEHEPIVTIQNIVATVNLGGEILLEKVAQRLPKTMYEPEQFPGVVLRVDDPKTVLLLFTSGKLVCTGGMKEIDIYRAVDELHKTLEKEQLIVY